MNTGEKSRMSRRRFLALAGGTIAVTTLACCGLTTFNPQQSEIDFAELNCGDENEMSEKILFMLNAMKVPEGDYRDWNAIRAWATDVGPMLLNA
jgi:hypothetical protein